MSRAVAAGGKFAGGSRHSFAAAARDASQRNGDIRRDEDLAASLLHIPVGIEAFGILPDDDQIHVLVRRFHPRQCDDGADAGEQFEPLTEADVDRPEPLPDRGGTRAFQGDPIPADHFEGFIR